MGENYLCSTTYVLSTKVQITTPARESFYLKHDILAAQLEPTALWPVKEKKVDLTNFADQEWY